VFVEALQLVLTTDAGMIAILGTPSARPDSTNGVFPVQAIDQPTMPYMVVSQVSGAPASGETMAGTGPLTTERWRFSCSGTTYLKAKKFAKYARRFLLSLYGPQTAAKITLQSVDCLMEADDAEPLGKGTLYTTHFDIEFVYVDLDVT
jgi:hypothetical protein